VRQFASVDLQNLDHLWFLVAGTRCNISCSHCFLDCSPSSRVFDMMSLEMVREYVEQSLETGVREYYFTGGEPLLNSELDSILEYTIGHGPITVLTNAMLITPERAKKFAEIASRSIYSFEFRISLDGYTPEMHDAIRGDHSFEKTLGGITHLCREGFLPIITITQTWDEQEHREVMQGFINVLKGAGYERPRVKVLPLIKIGKEAERTGSYTDDQWVTESMMNGYDREQLLCATSRMVTDRGVYVCPILVAEEGSRVGDRLSLDGQSYKLDNQACYTCYQYGAICSNMGQGDLYE
jgi:MoaA/NifB/PqqE/SkfB family radical SAM enzyme